MFCASELSCAVGGGVAPLVVIVVIFASAQLFALRLPQQTQRLVWGACYAVTLAVILAPRYSALACVVGCATALASSAASPLTSDDARGAHTAPTLGVARALPLVGLCVAASSTGVCGSFIAIEITSVAALLLVVSLGQCRSTSAILTYYWVGVVCAIGLSLVSAAALIGSACAVSGSRTATTVAAFIAISTKLGALPTGIWAVRFYGGLPLRTLSAYLSLVYLPLVAVALILLVRVVSVCGAPNAALVALVGVSASATAVLALGWSSHSSTTTPQLVVALTSVTVALLALAASPASSLA